jgi:flagellar assembly protein FliH
MSLSNIIRKGGEPQQSFRLVPIGEVPPESGEDGFRPVQLGYKEPEPVPEDELEPEPLPPCIPEEEALRRIQQAQADGLKEGRRQAESDFSKVSEALAQALLATGSLRPKILQESEEDLLKLSILIARTVIQRELSCDPWILAAVVQGAIEAASDGGEVVVRLNPQDYPMVARRPEFSAAAGEKRRVSLKEDPAIPSAGCLVETSRGTLDAGLDAQLDEIYRRLCEEKCARRGEASGD